MAAEDEGVQEEGWPTQVKPGSTLQPASQPSPFMLAWSSQASPPSRMPSPQDVANALRLVLTVPPGEAVTCRTALWMPGDCGLKRMLLTKHAFCAPGATVKPQPVPTLSKAGEPLSDTLNSPDVPAPTFCRRKSAGALAPNSGCTP